MYGFIISGVLRGEMYNIKNKTSFIIRREGTGETIDILDGDDGTASVSTAGTDDKEDAYFQQSLMTNCSTITPIITCKYTEMGLQ
jgi:hypothetical protein